MFLFRFHEHGLSDGLLVPVQDRKVQLLTCLALSLYDPVHSDSGDPLLVMDQISDPRSSDERWLEELSLKDALAELGERERRILSLRYYDGRTKMEVARAIGISQAQVSRLEKGALNRLRKAIVS